MGSAAFELPEINRQAARVYIKFSCPFNEEWNQKDDLVTSVLLCAFVSPWFNIQTDRSPAFLHHAVSYAMDAKPWFHLKK